MNVRIAHEYMGQVLDKKGRTVGGYATIEAAKRQTAEGGFSQGFWVRVFATRDGEKFGAAPQGTFHLGMTAAETHARKALRKQEERYRRLYLVGGNK